MIGDPRLYTWDWWQVKEEEASALRERQERADAEREAKALAGPGPPPVRFLAGPMFATGCANRLRFW
jgi:hypothetical protein